MYGECGRYVPIISAFNQLPRLYYLAGVIVLQMVELNQITFVELIVSSSLFN